MGVRGEERRKWNVIEMNYLRGMARLTRMDRINSDDDRIGTGMEVRGQSKFTCSKVIRTHE